MGAFPVTAGHRDQAWRLRALVDAIAAPSAPAASPDRARSVPVVAIASGKGGVGKTNIAVNLCVSFAQRGVRASLLDADLGMANADLLCGLTPSRRLDDVILDRSVSVSSCAVRGPGGFLLVPGAVGVARVADLGPRERTRLVDQLALLESASDAILVDTGAGVGREVLAFAGAADLLLVVVTPEPTSITDAYGLIKCAAAAAAAAAAARRPRVALVVNQAAGSSQAASVAGRVLGCCRRFLGFEPELLGTVRADTSVGRAVHRRCPHLLDSPKCKASKDIRLLASALAASVGL